MKMLLLILTLSLSLAAQQPDRWREMVIGESTPEQALEKFGKPKLDKVGEKFYLQNHKWFIDAAWKNLRLIHWEGIEGFKDVKLAFQDSKLVVIHLEPEKLQAQELIATYKDLDFRFAHEVMSPGDFKTARNTDDKPAKLDAVYGLVSVTDTVVVYGLVGNATGSVMSGMFGGTARQRGRSTPGKVAVIQLISRTLERTGSELLQ